MERLPSLAIAILTIAVAALVLLVLRLDGRIRRLSQVNEQMTLAEHESSTRLAAKMGRLHAEQIEMKQLLTLAPKKARSTFDFIVAQKARLATLGRHEATERALRSMATALGSYQVDYNFYPMSLDDLEPYYAAHAPTKDGWGHAMEYEVQGPRPRNYTLTAPGQDGALGTVDDYTVADGVFEQTPDVKKLSVDPLDLPGKAPYIDH